MNDILAIDEASAGYGRTSVLGNISISFGESETVALLGPNGSGKSTVARTIMGLTTLYSGAVHWQGSDVSRMPTWQRARMGLGYVPQVANVFYSLRVDENLMVGAGDLPKPEAGRRLQEIYDLFPMLAQRQTVAAGNLSGGERRLLAFATTLVQHPSFLILDEPTSDLAPASIELVFSKIREVRERLGLPFLLIEQNVDLALELVDRVCVLVRGAVVIDCPAAKLDEAQLAHRFLDRKEGSTPPDNAS
jgi:branched-chain amino acid transport system ATP-binding protein